MLILNWLLFLLITVICLFSLVAVADIARDVFKQKREAPRQSPTKENDTKELHRILAQMAVIDYNEAKRKRFFNKLKGRLRR